MIRRNASVAVAGLAALIPTIATAADAPAFCAGAASPAVSKDLIADTMLDAGGVTRGFARRVDALPPAERRGLTTAQAIVVRNITLCRQLTCSDAEKKQLSDTGFAFAQLLTDTDHVSVTGVTDPANFFAEPTAELRCKPAETAAAEPPVPVTTPDKNPLWDTGNFRIRGSGTDLIYPRGSAAFGDVDKAVLSFSDDNAAGKTASKLVAAGGYSFLFGGHPNADRTRRFTYGVIPYLGVNIDTSRVAGKPREVGSDQLEVGASLIFVADVISDRIKPAGYLTHYAALTPRYLVNYADDSAFVGANLLYRPTILLNPQFGLNRIQEIDGTNLRWGFILDGRLNYGHFVRTGSRTGEDAKDFLRIGPRFGLAIVNGTKDLPIEFTISDTWLASVSGGRSNLNLFKSNLSVYFNEKRYFGVDLAYAKGGDDDFAEAVDSWTIGFAIKY